MADALCWHAAPPEILDELDVPTSAVARGLLFRILTTSTDRQGQDPVRLEEEVRRHDSVLDALDL